MWAPPGSEREGERRGTGRWRAAAGCCGLKVGMGRGVGWWVGFVFFFFFFFKYISNQFLNHFKFKSFTSFRVQILTQISPTIIRLFENPFKQPFKHFFKIQTLSLFFLIQTFTPIFTIIFREF
jgi:hypothetical protein